MAQALAFSSFSVCWSLSYPTPGLFSSRFPRTRTIISYHLPMPASWQRATKFREHLSFISTDRRPNNIPLKSQFSPPTPSDSLPPSEEPELPVRPVHLINTPPPIKTNWSKSGSSYDLERGTQEFETNQRPWKSRLSFWRSTSAHPDRM